MTLGLVLVSLYSFCCVHFNPSHVISIRQNVYFYLFSFRPTLFCCCCCLSVFQSCAEPYYFSSDQHFNYTIKNVMHWFKSQTPSDFQSPRVRGVFSFVKWAHMCTPFVQQCLPKPCIKHRKAFGIHHLPRGFSSQRGKFHFPILRSFNNVRKWSYLRFSCFFVLFYFYFSLLHSLCTHRFFIFLSVSLLLLPSFGKTCLLAINTLFPVVFLVMLVLLFLALV